MTPPRLPARLLAHLLHVEDRAEILGDLEEDFVERVATIGQAAARRWYWRQAIGIARRCKWRRSLADVATPLVARARIDWPSELRRSWRGVRARGARVIFIVGLLGVALAASTVVFSATDSLVFRRLPYHEPDRLLTFARVDPEQGGRLTQFSATSDVLDRWRSQPDLFAQVHGYNTGRITFVLGPDQPTLAQTVFVTPGLIEMLGWTPKWGRPLKEEDASDTSAAFVLVSEGLARTAFGDPHSAVGASLHTNIGTLVIAGVMPSGFRFPNGQSQIWRPLDYRRLGSRPGVEVIARLTHGVSIDRISAALPALVSSTGPAVPGPSGWPVQARALVDGIGMRRGDPQLLLFVLLGAALSLLAVACANVASLELAGAMKRARVNAIHLVLGASRSTLARMVALEGGMLIGGALIVAVGLSSLALGVIDQWLPDRLRTDSANPIDLDLRALMFLAIAAAGTWAIASLPLALIASKRRLTDLLVRDDRTASGSPTGARARAVLTVAEVACAVVLLAGSGLFVRTYLSLVTADKGFDSSGVAKMSLTLPPSGFPVAPLSDEILARLRRRGDVKGVTESTSLDIQMSTTGHLEVDGAPPATDETVLSIREVDAAYFQTLQIPLLRGRLFGDAETSDSVIVSKPFADRVWPGTDPIGHRFRVEAQGASFTVIGVVAATKNISAMPDDVPKALAVYTAIASRTLQAASAPPRAAVVVPTEVPPNLLPSGPIFRFKNFLVRLDPPNHLDQIVAEVRAVGPGFQLDVEWIDETYAKTFADRLLAARIVSGLGGVAFLVSIAGVYGLMAFLVAGRAREIGIRMALGASRDHIMRLVVSTSIQLVGLGAAVGMAIAMAGARWLESQWYGISPLDPITYAGVAVVVMSAALFATWLPARKAASIDPAITLRAE